MTQGAQKRQRSCIACGRQDGKATFLRIVRTNEGSALFDASGRMAGRGAYVCSAQCFAVARKAKRLDRALRMKVSEQDYETIAGKLACVDDAKTTD